MAQVNHQIQMHKFIEVNVSRNSTQTAISPIISLAVGVQMRQRLRNSERGQVNRKNTIGNKQYNTNWSDADTRHYVFRFNPNNNRPYLPVIK